MKYLLLIYQNHAQWETLAEEERNGVAQEATDLWQELVGSGEWVDGHGLAHPSTARTVRVREGVPAVTDGPFVEAKEQLAGFCVFETDNLERATEIAARWPDARYWAVELRPLMDPSASDL